MEELHTFEQDEPVAFVPEPEESEWAEGASPYDGDHPDQDQPDAVGIRSLVSFVRSGKDAIKWALGITSYSPSGMCQQFTRRTFNVNSLFGSAAAAWAGAHKKHPTSDRNACPEATPVYFLGGSRGYGHAAVSLGNGLVRSTDWPSAGRVGTARIVDIERAWGQRFVGWTEDINGVTVWEKPAPPKPMISARLVARRTRKGLPVPNGVLLKRAVAKEVGAGGMELTHKVLGKAFREQYKLVQIKFLHAQGQAVTKEFTDGIPGLASLRWLGQRHGFDVH